MREVVVVTAIDNSALREIITQDNIATKSYFSFRTNVYRVVPLPPFATPSRTETPKYVPKSVDGGRRK